VLPFYNTHGLIHAALGAKLTWFRPHRRVFVPYQSGIESCRGRFIDLSHVLKPSPMRSSNKAPMRFGANPPLIRLKATYHALKPIAVSYPRVREASSLTRLLRLNAVQEPPWRRGGILILQTGYYSEPTRRERSMPQSRYQGSLMGNHNSLMGRSS